MVGPNPRGAHLRARTALMARDEAWTAAERRGEKRGGWGRWSAVRRSGMHRNCWRARFDRSYVNGQ